LACLGPQLGRVPQDSRRHRQIVQLDLERVQHREAGSELRQE
jgi:hypothetical protein